MFGVKDIASLSTSDITLISHTHGRERRAERNIARLELQAAIKYGRKERATPGVNKDARWKYTYKGVVYITDATSRHEVTSWRLDEDEAGKSPIVGEESTFSSHVVLVVDCSGSMRANDCAGFNTRTKCTYESICNDLIIPQIACKAQKTEAGNIGEAVVSLIEMRDNATLLLERVPLDEQLLKYMRKRGNVIPRSHGHYIPALDTVIALLKADVSKPVQFFVIFLSDGAPSDHVDLSCIHGVQVWQKNENGEMKVIKGEERAALKECGERRCRQELVAWVNSEIIKRVRKLGDMCGRDRLRIHTVAFGNPNEEFAVLQQVYGGRKLTLFTLQLRWLR